MQRVCSRAENGTIQKLWIIIIKCSLECRCPLDSSCIYACTVIHAKSLAWAHVLMKRKLTVGLFVCFLNLLQLCSKCQLVFVLLVDLSPAWNPILTEIRIRKVNLISWINFVITISWQFLSVSRHFVLDYWEFIFDRIVHFPFQFEQNYILFQINYARDRNIQMMCCFDAEWSAWEWPGLPRVKINVNLATSSGEGIQPKNIAWINNTFPPQLKTISAPKL